MVNDRLPQIILYGWVLVASMVVLALFFAFVSMLLEPIVVIIRPTWAQCPGSWGVVEGIRRVEPDVGAYICEAPLAKCCGEPVPGPCAKTCHDVPRYRSRIYCTGGARPIVVDWKTVGCQR